MILRIYTFLTYLAVPILRLYLLKRMSIGKEDALRMKERFGHSPHTRGEGADYVWLHGASVGESLSLLPFMEHLEKVYPNVRFVLTSGTVASAEILRKKLTPHVIHQYIPLDTKPWMMRFLKHFRPKLVIITESEIWPMMLLSCKEKNIPVYLINGRLGEKSAKTWARFPRFSEKIFSSFAGIFALSKETQAQFQTLSPKTHVHLMPNLKFAAPDLEYKQEDVLKLTPLLAHRKIIVAASTHRGEEDIILNVYARLKRDMPELLLILAPRHTARIGEVLTLLQKHKMNVCRRASRGTPTEHTDIFLFDTMGEMGLAYHFCHIALVGGSLVPGIGGHNPLEPGRLGKCTFHGPFMDNAKDILEHIPDGFIPVDKDTLEGALSFYLNHPKNAMEMGELARAQILEKKNHLKELVEFCVPHLGQASSTFNVSLDAVATGSSEAVEKKTNKLKGVNFP